MKGNDWMLKKGDKVVMHTCLEAETYNGRIWTCEGDEFKANSSGNGVFLEGFSGYFYTEYLQKVNVTGIELKNIDLTGISEEEQWNKIAEENTEFFLALNNEDKANSVEEFWDCMQVRLGMLQIRLGITAEEVQAYYPKHLEKLKDRPRHKEE
jgi:phosphoribosyl-ATP pyrophosphohydrolase